jgi:hypothetical protein
MRCLLEDAVVVVAVLGVHGHHRPGQDVDDIFKLRFTLAQVVLLTLGEGADSALARLKQSLDAAELLFSGQPLREFPAAKAGVPTPDIEGELLALLQGRRQQ